ncbi:MAG: keto-hydroxyglutarate-aldolase/keto-deoxy-phosphogluconate aldolase, partial [Lachnospiraceae bacterium]|nr:keto-hydroxyglutarate-aldolase/keto-deoxy-phosphogluconate aldolase [Lachnospiraceae bacterium]
MNEIFEKFYQIGIIPVVVLEDEKDAKPLGEALIAGGLPCAEVTFRTGAAQKTIETLRNTYPEMLTGAGTVLTVEQAD